MIVLSWVFLAAAIATLVIGVFSELVWVYVSIGASVLALIFLLAGILRRKPVQPATAGAPYGPSPEEAAARGRPAAAATATAPAPAPPAQQRRPAEAPAPAPVMAPEPATLPEEAPVAAAAAPAAATTTSTPRKSAAKKTAAKKTAAKKTPARKSAAKKTAAAGTSSRAMVTAIPERGTFHTSECRYVQGRDDTERVQLGTAKTRGYTACKVCKPES